MSEGRTSWSEAETRALINLWEANLSNLRRQKRNGKVYQQITDKLRGVGIVKNKKQVHGKIENLTQKYRRVRRSMGTGSGAVSWPFYWDIHKFLGSFPVNDITIVEDTLANPEQTFSNIIGCNVVTDEGEHFEDSCDAPGETEQHDLTGSSIFDHTSETSRGPSSLRSSPAPSPTPLPARRKRRTEKSVDILREILKESRALHEEMMEATNREHELRRRQLQLQEEANETQKRIAACLEQLVKK
ncbi:myb/SANT-like DNA-binding domain-containing protein 1 isoform X2 [Ornithodoros turicata]|uniref:myb/SANT-like DNA-binding domain-containing protein 1 isoform X2 n=1 Tax=Ornithodoros turicata TaxID=34597 RepID=UPI0031391417